MKIEINNRPAGPWGRIGIDAAATAASALSGDTFKVWIRLALNQDGYVWQGKMEPDIADELADHGYLCPLDGGGYVFDTSGEAAPEELPESWRRIAELYGSTDSRRDYRYVVDKLDSADLSDQTDGILAYWSMKYSNLQEVDHSKAKNRLKYDLSVLLTWWVQEHFRFQPGDVLRVGTGGNRLRYHDADLKEKIQHHVMGKENVSLTLDEKAAATWNQYLKNGAFEVPFQEVAAILRSRGGSE